MLRAAVALFLVGAVYGGAVKFEPCPNSQDSICSVENVQITPCTNPKKCRLLREDTTHLSFDFTPKFSAETLNSGAFFVTEDSEMSFDQIGLNACNYTTCPAVANTKQSYDYSLYIGKMIPGGTFTIRWKVWDAADETKICCFKIDIKISK